MQENIDGMAGNAFSPEDYCVNMKNRISQLVKRRAPITVLYFYHHPISSQKEAAAADAPCIRFFP